MDNLRKMISSICGFFRAFRPGTQSLGRTSAEVYTNSIKNKWHFVIQSCSVFCLVFLPLFGFSDCHVAYDGETYYIQCNVQVDDNGGLSGPTNAVAGIVDCLKLKQEVINIYSNEQRDVMIYLQGAYSDVSDSIDDLKTTMDASLPLYWTLSPGSIRLDNFSAGGGGEYYWKDADDEWNLDWSTYNHAYTLFNESLHYSESVDTSFGTSSINFPQGYSVQRSNSLLQGGQGYTSMLSSLDSATNNIVMSMLLLQEQEQSFRSKVMAMPCIECSGGSGSGSSGSCCSEVDLSGVLSRLDSLIAWQHSLSNQVSQIVESTDLLPLYFQTISNNTTIANLYLSSISNSVSAFNNDWLRGFFAETYDSWGDYYDGAFTDSNIISVQGWYRLFGPRTGNFDSGVYQQYDDVGDFVSFLSFIGSYLPDMIGSLNNYSYLDLKHKQYMTNWTARAVSSVTNSLGILSSVVGQSSPLREFSPAVNSSLGETYHAFLTNYYIQISTGQASGTRTHTNYFDRIEMLLAALVFNDEEGINTNQVSSISSADQSSLENAVGSTLSDSRNLMVSRLSKFNDVGGSVVEILSTFNQTFSNLTLPSSVNLMAVTVGDSNLQIHFGSEELGVLPQILRAATSCAFYFVGLLLLWRFLKWVVKNLWWEIKFIYLFISAAFHKS